MPEGHEAVFEGEGDESPDWEPGDVVLRVHSAQSEGGFKRKEISLYWTEAIGVDEVSSISLHITRFAYCQLDYRHFLGSSVI